MTRILADTSVWMRRAQPEVAELLGDAIEADEIVLTCPVELELLRTARNAAELVVLREECATLRRVQVDPRVEERALRIQASSSWRGRHRGPSSVDLLAAAAAEEAGAELWHCDRHLDLTQHATGQPMRRVGT
ncbi:MAG: PIN domain-containing protein [Gaiella sp.]